MKLGKFITFEGGEGAGKSTQVRLLAQSLAGLGVEVVQTREPGGAPQAELLRELLISGDTDRWSSGAEALLNYAARDDHLRSTIRPALERGAWVLCDRFSVGRPLKSVVTQVGNVRSGIERHNLGLTT